MEKFFWNMFCDNYLEIVKKRIYQNKKGKESAQYALYNGLLNVLKLIAPIMPFITEEIYQTYFKKNEKDESIHLSEWPVVSLLLKGNKDSKIAENSKFDKLIDIIVKVRQKKSDNKKSMNSEIVLHISKKEYDEIGDMIEDLKDVTNAVEVKEGRFKVEFVE